MQPCHEVKQSSPVFVETVPTPVNKTGSWRFLTPVLKEKISPCGILCPLECEIPRWVNEVKEGNWQEAWKIMRRYNPFPAITGYTCYRFCMEKCSRTLLDEAVAIGEIEKEIGLWRLNNFDPDNPVFASSQPCEQRREKAVRVAIVGSGPAGLSCAYYLNEMGMEVTVLEKLPVAGGLLATGIPEYRLPREVLRKELEILKVKGITIGTNQEMGKGSDLQDLQDNYAAVLLAVGAQENRPFNIKGDHLLGITGALEFLRDLHIGRLAEVQGRVLVIGGGNAALDAACMASRHGAEEVTLLYRRSREEMPAHVDEVKAAAEAGVNFVYQTVVQEIIGQEKVQRARTLQTAPSRRGETVKTLPGTDLYLDCNLIIVATGGESGLRGLVPSYQDYLVGEKNAPVSFEGTAVKMLAAGDAVTGPANVAAAIFGGRQAALEIYKALDAGKEEDSKCLWISPPRNGREKVVTRDALNPSLFLKHKRYASPQEEAARCFSCGTCSQCGVCWAFCPDLAVEYRSGSYEINLDYCKGCGICVAECPAGVLEMEEVEKSGT